MGDEAQKNSAKPKGQYDVARIPPKMLRGQLVPERFELDGVVYTLEKHLKADFFAATGRYADPEGRRVCLKHFHTESWIGMPLGWAGRHMCNREIGFYRLLEDVAGVPRLVGKLGESGLVHQWIEGCDLLDYGQAKETPPPLGEVPPSGGGEGVVSPVGARRPQDQPSPGPAGHPLPGGEGYGKQSFGLDRRMVADDFFDRLEQLTLELHSHGVAYVDLNKPDNVLVGDDGRPYLVDFQISFQRPSSRWRIFGQSLFRQLCREDLYHVRKLKRKFRRDLMTPEELAASYDRSWVLSIHRKFAHPFQQVRRWVLTRLGAR